MTEQQAQIMAKLLAATTDSTKARLVREYARLEVEASVGPVRRAIRRLGKRVQVDNLGLAAANALRDRINRASGIGVGR